VTFLLMLFAVVLIGRLLLLFITRFANAGLAMASLRLYTLKDPWS
jgi:hypothetical protein